MKISLLGGDSPSRSTLASCQRRLNMYSEATDQKQGEPGQITLYPRPGLRLLGTTPGNLPIRALYRASNGDLYCVAGAIVYYINSQFVFTSVGTLNDVTKATQTVIVAPIAASIILTSDGTPTGTQVSTTPLTANTAVGTALLVSAGMKQTNVTSWALSGANAAEYTIASTGLVSTADAIPSGSMENITISATIPDVTQTIVTVVQTGATSATNTVKMADNGTSVIICDGSLNNGWSFDMTTRTDVKPLLDPTASDAETDSSTGWLGSTYVDFTDTYFVANYPGTPTFFISNSEDVIFDPDQFGSKSSYPDSLVAAIVQHRVIWLIGELFTEIWFNSGGGSIAGNNFPFELIQGVAIDYGCVSTYSIAKAETAIFWLAQNQNGDVLVLKGSGETVSRVSNHAVEDRWRHYSDVTDAIAFTYMQDGHSFYVLSFPTGDETWVLDLAMGEWHQWAWLDPDGIEHRARTDLHAFAYQTNVVNDWENGNLYALDLETYTDNLQPIKRVVGFPRQIDPEDNLRMKYIELMLEIDVGDATDYGTEPDVFLRWSDDKGKTWGNRIAQSLGLPGQYNKLLRFFRMGIARNRNYEVSTSAACKFAIQGAFIITEKAGS